MSNVIDLPYKFKLRWYQRKVWNALFLDNFKKFMLVWHRRAGKDDLCINVASALMMTEPMYALYLLPQQKQARKVMWHGVSNDGIPLVERIPKQLIKRKSSVEMLIELINGSVIQLAGSDNYNSLMGTNPKLIINSEYGLANPYARQYLRPILVQNKGIELNISTPRGMNHLYAGYNVAMQHPKEWFCSKLTVDDTYDHRGYPIVTKAEIEAERREGAREETIQSEYFCDFTAAILGAYYATQLRQCYFDNRILNSITIDPNLPTVTMWDIGHGDGTAIWIAQIKNGNFYFIRYYYRYGETFAHYANFLKSFATDNGLTYHAHIGPHDLNVTEYMGTKKTRLERALYEYGIRFETVLRTHDVTEDIEVVRDWFHTFYFDRSQCGEGLACLAQYHSEFVVDLNIHKPKPVHDWSSHGADALRYGMMWYDHQKIKPSKAAYGATKIYNPFDR